MDDFIYSRHSRLFFGQRMLNEARAQEERNKIRNIRIGFRNTFDPVQDLSENSFRDTYRLTKDAFLFLCEELRNHTHLKSTQRITLETKVLTALLFYASGSYQRPIGVAKHLSQKMCSTYIEEVTQALIHPKMINKYICFPQTAAERQSISHRFYIKYGIPGVIGSIDGSHFRIFGPPKEEEHLFFCRKQYYSINVQMICDSEYRILNVNPRFGGCNHDSFIWENSDINPYMQSLHESGEMYWLLGDSGYPQRPWLMTPILDAVDGSPEALYNDKHAAARVVIENVFGRLKNRWRCLCKDRFLHYKPKKCAQIIQACCVLHNLFLNFQGPETDRHEDYRDDESSSHAEIYREPPGSITTDLIRGRSMRQQLVHRLHH